MEQPDRLAAAVVSLPGGRAAALAFSKRHEELVTRHLEALATEIPDWTVQRPDLSPQTDEIARGSLRLELDTLRTGRPLPGTCPPPDADLAALAVSIGAPLDPLLVCYRVANAVLLDAWIDEVDRHGVDAAARAALLRAGSAFLFGYAGRLSTLITERYTREHDALVRGLAQRRVQVVRALLDGEDVGEELGHTLDGHHVAVVAMGAQAPEAIGELARALDRQALVIPQVGDLWWGWLSGTRPLGRAALAAPWQLRAGVRAGIGDEHRGPEGFRRSHGEALAAFRAGRDGQPLVRYRDVALEALATIDRAAARRFVEGELTGFGGDDGRASAIRNTLEAYFAAGHNAAAAARALGIHEQTVAARLRTVETLIASPPAARRAELETALRLRRMLDAR